MGQVLDALDGTSMPARDITDAVPVLGTRIVMGSGKHTATAKATSRALGLMAVEGLLARGRPSGGWTNRQYVWHRRDQWLPLPEDAPDEAAASVELVRRYLERFGPVTLTDVQWWTGWTKTKTRKALAELDAIEVALEGQDEVGLVLSDDVDPVEPAESWVALLPALDPTAMGWKQREWYVGEWTAESFDRNGNIGPTIWADGRVVGAWSQNQTGAIATHLFEKLRRKHQTLLKARVAAMADFIGDAHVKPSFPTPRQKQLAASE